MQDPRESVAAATRGEDGTASLIADLVERGELARNDARRAQEMSESTGTDLGRVLVSTGLVDRRALYRVQADRWGVEVVDLFHEHPPAELLARHDPELLAAQGWVPLERRPDGSVRVATAMRPDEEWHTRVEAVVGAPVLAQATTDWDVVQALQRWYRELLADRASYGLWRRSPHQSARTVVDGRQAVVFGSAAIATSILLGLYPRGTMATLTLLASLAFFASIAFKFVVSLRGARAEQDVGVTDAEVVALVEEDLPIYTVLVPVYREANVVAQLIDNLGHLDYPVGKLEILLLMEENDSETIEAARASSPPATVTFVIVPDGAPKTKPKACNVGLFFARGEYLVIYDAEDRPDPDQLKKALVAFRKAGDRTVCVQAALNYWNDSENFLTRMFTLEYSFWFDYMLPGLNALDLPIPLGGTSNHFRTAALRELGGWDPFNVTEDADLGIRAAALGYHVGVVNSTTFEEANRAPRNWVRQRSRWVKGYLHTALVHLRHPVALVKVAGLRRTLAFALLVGGTPVSFLLAPILWAMFAVSLLLPVGEYADFVPPWVMYVATLNLLAGNGLMIYVSMMGAFKRRRYRLVLWSLLNPVYWVLLSIASYKAAFQLVTRPHYWEKTVHGLSTVDVTVEAAS